MAWLTGIVYYPYLLFTLGFAIIHGRNLNFVRVTLAYCVVMTALICVVLYGSSHSLLWEGYAWHLGRVLVPLPLTVVTDSEQARASLGHWLSSALGVAFHITLPMAIWRGAGLYLTDPKSRLQELVRANVVTSRLKAVAPTGYAVGQATLVVVVVVKSVLGDSPGSIAAWLVMLASAYVAVMISGCDLTGAGVVARVSRPLARALSRGMHWLLAYSLSALAYVLAACFALVALVFMVGLVVYLVVVLAGSQPPRSFLHDVPTFWWVVVAVVAALGLAGNGARVAGWMLLQSFVRLTTIPFVAVLRLIDVDVPDFYRTPALLTLPKAVRRRLRDFVE